MSYVVSTRPFLQTPQILRDEFLCRRSSFRSGSEIQLSDGQTWIFPPPPEELEREAASIGAPYANIIQAMLEVEDSSELCFAELSFAIFLLEQNYYLSPADYENLLSSSTDSAGKSDWQYAFHEIAQEHMQVFTDSSRGQFEY